MFRTPLPLAVLAVLALTACKKDNTSADNHSGPTSTAESASPLLPATPFNYADIALPNHVNIPPVQATDNTPADNPITDEGATLGRVLFYDVNLSFNRTVSCASCHDQASGFSDPNTLSVGFDGGLTGRNSMGLSMARFYENGHFFWDERAATLEEQVLMPIQDDVEMGMSLDELVERVEAEEYYAELFADAFGSDEVSTDRISRALSQFVRSMVSANAKYDEGRAQVQTPPGPDQTFPNFTAAENQGMQLFFASGCAACHGGEAFIAPGARNNGLDVVYTDNGTADVTGDPADVGKFKVPSLRNVAVTGPFMHDGRFETLLEVVEHYNSGVQDHVNLDPVLRDGANPRVLNLTENEKLALVAFLETLTDPTFLSDERWSDPFTGN